MSFFSHFLLWHWIFKRRVKCDESSILGNQFPPQSGIVLAFENQPDVFRGLGDLHGVPNSLLSSMELAERASVLRDGSVGQSRIHGRHKL